MTEQARRGIFANNNAISRLIDAMIIDDFLFNNDLPREYALRFLEPVREIHFRRSIVGPQSCLNSHT